MGEFDLICTVFACTERARWMVHRQDGDRMCCNEHYACWPVDPQTPDERLKARRLAKEWGWPEPVEESE